MIVVFNVLLILGSEMMKCKCNEKMGNVTIISPSIEND